MRTRQRYFNLFTAGLFQASGHETRTAMGSIGSIQTRGSMRPGAPVRISVLDKSGTVFAANGSTSIVIDGVAGPSQTRSWFAAGTFAVSALAYDSGGALVDVVTDSVTIGGPPVLFDSPAGRSMTAITFTPNPLRPYGARLGMGVLVPSANPYSSGKTAPVDPTQRYQWTIEGHFTAIVTDYPTLDHDFTWNVDHGREHTSNTIRCVVLRDGVPATSDDGEPLVAERTVVFGSTFALSRAKGYLVPFVQSAQVAEVAEGIVTCSFIVENVGYADIALESRSITPHMGESDDPAPYLAVPKAPTIPARTSAAVVVVLRSGIDVPRSADGVTIRFSGRAANGSDDGLQVRIGAAFDLPLRAGGLLVRDRVDELEQWPWEEIVQNTELTEPPRKVATDRASGTIVGTIGAAGGGAPTPALFGLLDEIGAKVRSFADKKYAGQRVSTSALVFPNLGLLDGPKPSGGDDGGLQKLPGIGSVSLGQVCDPDDLDDDTRKEGQTKKLTCAIAPTTMPVKRPGRWMNARKGDIILSPRDDGGLVGQMFKALVPFRGPRLYSHCGVLSKSYEEITHATSSSERLAHLAKEHSGFFPEAALRKQWPGLIRQSVEASIVGELWMAPADPIDTTAVRKAFSISSFAPARNLDNDSGVALQFTPAAVLKPDPVLEVANPLVRRQLHDLANDLREHSTSAATVAPDGYGTKFHYRFYCFTDGAFNGVSEPSDTSWARETRPAVCTTVIASHMKNRGMHMSVPDGLSLYTAEERRAVADLTYEVVVAMVEQALSPRARESHAA